MFMCFLKPTCGGTKGKGLVVTQMSECQLLSEECIGQKRDEVGDSAHSAFYVVVCVFMGSRIAAGLLVAIFLTTQGNLEMVSYYQKVKGISHHCHMWVEPL